MKEQVQGVQDVSSSEIESDHVQDGSCYKYEQRHIVNPVRFKMYGSINDP